MGFMLGFMFGSIVRLFFTIAGLFMRLIMKIIGFVFKKGYSTAKLMYTPEARNDEKFVRERDNSLAKYAKEENEPKLHTEKKAKVEAPIVSRRSARV